MGAILNQTRLHAALQEIDLRIDRLNEQKIIAFFDFLGLKSRKDLPDDFLVWNTILVVLPNRSALQRLRVYKTSISRIAFIANANAEQIHIYDLDKWKSAVKNKTALQIREMMKTNFGGVPKKDENRDWTKLFK